MSLLKNVAAAFETTMSDVVKEKLEPVELDTFRLGGDISTLATKLGELMDGMRQHKEIIQQIAKQHHQLVSMVNEKKSHMRFPALFGDEPLGNN